MSLSRTLCSVIATAAWAASTSVQAQSSIAAENIIDTVVFSYTDAAGAKQQDEVTIVRDEVQTEQWYYMPSSPRLVTTTVGGKAVPQFSLLVYEYPDPTNPQTILREGLLNFSARLSFPPQGLAAMMTAARDAVAKRKGQVVAEKIRLAAMPINSATVTLFTDDGRLVSSTQGTGTAPTFASQQMAFSMKLTQLGTAVFDALIKSPAGIRTAVQFTYNGLTPKCGYRITADYSQARDFYSKNEKFAARASYFGWFSASASKETTEIRDTLQKNGVLDIQMLASNQCPPERLDALMQPILKRINDQVIETFKPPEKIDPAVAGSPSSGGYFGGVGYTVAVKQVSELRTLKETVNFEQATIVERTTVAQGLIGIGNYSEEVKKGATFLVDGTKNPGTYVGFPSVPPGVERVDLDLRLTARGQPFGLGQYQFLRASNAWKNLQTGAVPDRISFSLAGIVQAFGDAGLNDARLTVNRTIHSLQDSSTSVSSGPVSKGPAVLELRDGLFGVRLFAAGVPYRNLGGDYIRAQVIAKAGTKSNSYVFQPISANGVWQPPADEFFFAPQKGTPVELTIRLTHSDPAKSVTKTQTIVADGMVDVFLDSVLW